MMQNVSLNMSRYTGQRSQKMKSDLAYIQECILSLEQAVVQFNKRHEPQIDFQAAMVLEMSEDKLCLRCGGMYRPTWEGQEECSDACVALSIRCGLETQASP